MEHIDEFASSLLEEAKRFLERAGESGDAVGEAANLHAALMLAFCSLEAHVNAVADEIALRPGHSPHILGILLEKDVHLKDGEFLVGKGLKMARLEDRILALHQLGRKPDTAGGWRPALAGAIDLRNKLTHPKAVPHITRNAVSKALQAVIDTVDALYGAVYKRRFPAAQRQLASKLDF